MDEAERATSTPANGRPWRRSPVALRFFGYYLVISITCTVVADVWFESVGSAKDSIARQVFNDIRTLLASALTIALLLSRYPGLARILKARLPIEPGHRPWRWATLAVATPISTLAIFVLGIVVLAVDVPEARPLVRDAWPVRMQVIRVIVIVAIGPFVEELIFRGALNEDLAGRVPNPLARALVLAAAFAFMHSALGLFALFGPVILSLLASRARHVTGSLGIAVLVHGVWNATVLSVTGLLSALDL